MASNPKPNSEAGNAPKSGSSQGSGRLPFEPGSSRKKSTKKSQPANAPQTAKSAAKPAAVKSPEGTHSATPLDSSSSTSAKAKQRQRQEPSIKQITPIARATVPEVVSQRMARRMAVFCGIPTAMGIVTFVLAYFIVTNEWFKLPNIAVVLVSMAWFGLGVVGLSYGVLSASWDESRVGTRLGWAEFMTNFARMRESWRDARQRL